MQMSEFMRLSHTEQSDYLYEKGTYVGKSFQGENLRVLYQVHHFYVEVCYREYRRFIRSIECFDSTTGLDPYLIQINIEELLNS
jgi:hypothetical protein